MKIRKMAAGIMMACLLFQVPQIPTYGALDTDNATVDIELEGKVLKNNMSVIVVVQDEKSLSKLKDATVALDDWSNYAITNRKGEVTLTGLKENQKYNIFVGRGGHESKLIEYTCKEDGAILNVFLEKEKNGGGGGGNGTPGGNGGGSGENAGPGFESSESQPGSLTPGQDGELVPGGPDGLLPDESDSAVTDGQNGADGTGDTVNGGNGTGGTGANGTGGTGTNGTGGGAGTDGEADDENVEIPEGDPLIDEMANGPGGISDDAQLPEDGEGIWKRITEEEIEESVKSGDPLVIRADQSGVAPLQTDAFSEHDKVLLGDNELWAKHTAAEGWSLIVVSEESQTETLVVREARIPHSIMETAKAKHADVQVVFRESGNGGTAALIPSSFFRTEDMSEKDLSVEYNKSTGNMSMAYSLPAEHGQVKKLVVSENALAFAAGKGFDLKARVYNPDSDDEIWYEWDMSAENLKQARIAATDLYIHNDSQDLDNTDNPLKYLTRWRRVQLFTINHHGPLPTTASLRVKNLAGFPMEKTVSYMTYNTDEGKSNLVFRDIGFDGEGFAVVPEMDHCSSYALAGAIWWWWYAIGAAIIAAVAALIYYFMNRKKKRSAIMNEVWVESQDEEDAGKASKIINMEANKASKASKETITDKTNDADQATKTSNADKTEKVSGGDNRQKNSEEDK